MTKPNLMRYDAARHALAECKRVDEVKDIHDKAIAMAVYARHAKDRDLIINATKIKRRAERRLGQIMNEQPKAVGARTKGMGRRGQRGSLKDPRSTPSSLADQGVDKHLADRARKAAAMSDDKFDESTERAADVAAAAAENDREVIRASKAKLHKEKKAKREAREKELAAKLAALPDKKYAVILADPEWRFETWSAKGLTNSSPDNHYPTSELEAIKQRDVASISANECVLFLWSTVPMLPQALEVMDAWGFKYVTNFAWIKNKAGTGYWNRGKHETLLVGTKGNIPAPAPGTQWESAIECPVGKHSQKPEKFLEMIEAYFPTVPKIELNRIGPARLGWDAWGLEAE